HFYDLPERLAIHWSWRGQPDGFVERSGTSAALPLLIGLLVCVLLAAFQAGLRRSVPGGAMRAATVKVLLAGEYFTAFICCGVLAATATSGRLLKPVRRWWCRWPSCSRRCSCDRRAAHGPVAVPPTTRALDADVQVACGICGNPFGRTAR